MTARSVSRSILAASFINAGANHFLNPETYLSTMPPWLPLAGSASHRAWIARVHGDEEASMNEWKIFLTQWTDSLPATQP